MRESLDALNKLVITFLDRPEMRALGVVFSVVSFLLALWLVRRQLRLARAQEQHIVFHQVKYIQELWHKTNAIILSDPQHVTIMKELWNYPTDDEVRKSCIIFNQLNPVYTAYLTREHVNDMARKHYNFELETVLENYSGDQQWLIDTLKKRGYADEFAKECNSCLNKLRSADKPAMPP